MRKAWTATAIVLLNTLLLLAAINLVAAVVLAGRGEDGRDAGAPARYPSAWLIDGYGFDVLKRAYPGWDEAQLRVLLTETSNWPQVYEPYTQFRPRPRHDTYITIDPAGFRPSPVQRGRPAEHWRDLWQRRAPADEALDVFVFGGSTTMGAGVPDAATVPAQLQARLDRDCGRPVRVFNFGRGFYFSSQERALFEKQLLAGARPDVALFVDGLNDFYFPIDRPQYSDRFAAYMDDANKAVVPADATGPSFGEAAARLVEALPAWRLWRAYAPAAITDAHAAEFAPPAGLDDKAETVVERWLANRRMIRAVADVFAVKLLFVWQPVPTYGYDLDYLNVAKDGKIEYGPHALSGVGYRLMAKRHAPGAPGDDLLWLADMQRGVRRNLYVDSAHYTEAFSRDIADAIYARLVADGTLGCVAK